MKANTTYERPKVQTLAASRIVELLGPVSCGSQFGASEMSPANSRLGSNWRQIGQP